MNVELNIQANIQLYIKATPPPKEKLSWAFKL